MPVFCERMRGRVVSLLVGMSLVVAFGALGWPGVTVVVLELRECPVGVPLAFQRLLAEPQRDSFFLRLPK